MEHPRGPPGSSPGCLRRRAPRSIDRPEGVHSEHGVSLRLAAGYSSRGAPGAVAGLLRAGPGAGVGRCKGATARAAVVSRPDRSRHEPLALSRSSRFTFFRRTLATPSVTDRLLATEPDPEPVRDPPPSHTGGRRASLEDLQHAGSERRRWIGLRHTSLGHRTARPHHERERTRRAPRSTVLTPTCAESGPHGVEHRCHQLPLVRGGLSHLGAEPRTNVTTRESTAGRWSHCCVAVNATTRQK